MKVCTDSCLFGAWTAGKIDQYCSKAENILDIGTGTGLLCVMLAQKTLAAIYGVEIDGNATKQAAHNFISSPWTDRLSVINSSVSDLDKNKKYDFIISNPPFYEASLRSPDSNRTAAMHDSELTLPQLISAILLHLKDNGYTALLIPIARLNTLEILAAENGLHVIEKTLVRQTVTHSPFRAMLLLSRNKTADVIVNEISILNENRNYTAEFSELLKDYYLKL
ncbi:MAG: methyltransferase [Ferruginibacter sp.]